MAYRTSQEAVKGILGGNYSATGAAADLLPFIETANTMVDEVVTCAAAKSVTLSTALREKIERFLAAHFYAHADQLYSEKQTGKASATFQGKTDMGLDSTQYGQTAKMFDISGCLRAMSKGQTVLKMTWLGKPPSEQTPYRDRD